MPENNNETENVCRHDTLPLELREQVVILHTLADGKENITRPPTYLFLTPSVEFIPLREMPLNCHGMERMGIEWIDDFEEMLTRQFASKLTTEGVYTFVYRDNLHDSLFVLERKTWPDKGKLYLLTRKAFGPVSVHF